MDKLLILKMKVFQTEIEFMLDQMNSNI